LTPQRAALGWFGVAMLLAVGALLVHGRAAAVLDWQPGFAWTEPWRWWSAAWVHWSGLHLGANLAGAVLVGALGVVADVPWRGVLAWLLAWPLTQLGLAFEPGLLRYGGLSGVLHAGVAIVAVQLVVEGPRARRALGALMLAGLATKLLCEAPWRGPLAHPPGWDIAIAPLAHVTGVVAGIFAALALRAWHAPATMANDEPTRRR